MKTMAMYVIKLEPELKERFDMAKAKRLMKGRFMAKVLRLAFENVVMEAFAKVGEADSDTLYDLTLSNENLKKLESTHPEPTFTQETPVLAPNNPIAPQSTDLKPTEEPGDDEDGDEDQKDDY